MTSKTRLIAKTKKVVVKKNCLKELAKDVLMEHVPVTVVKEAGVEVREVQEDLPEGVEDLDAGDDVQGCSEYAAHIYSHLRQLEVCPTPGILVPLTLTLTLLQAKYSLGRDPLASSTITPKMRAVLFDWMTQVQRCTCSCTCTYTCTCTCTCTFPQVQQEFKLVQETLFLSFSIVDRSGHWRLVTTFFKLIFSSSSCCSPRFLAVSGRHVFRSQLQLLGVTAMFVAAKVASSSLPPPTLPSSPMFADRGDLCARA